MKALVYFLLGFVLSAAFLFVPYSYAYHTVTINYGSTKIGNSYCIEDTPYTTSVSSTGCSNVGPQFYGYMYYSAPAVGAYSRVSVSGGTCNSGYYYTRTETDVYHIVSSSLCVCTAQYSWQESASSSAISGYECYEGACSNKFVDNALCDLDAFPLFNNGKKDDGLEDGIDCGGVCPDECIKSCPTGEKLFQTSGSSIYYCATVTSPDSNGVCTSGVPNASGTECHKIDFSGLVVSDQDYLDSIDNSTDSSDSPVSDSTYNYLDSNPATSGTTTTTKTTTNPDGSTTTTKTVTTIKSNGSTSVTTTKTTTNTDGSTTVSKTTVNYDADGNITGTSSSSGTTDADGNSETESGSDGDEADGDEVVAGDGAEALEVSEDIDLTYGSYGTAWDGFRDELAATTLVASVQAFTNAIPTQSTGPTYTLSFGRYGSHSINTNDYDDQLEIIGYVLLIMSSFIGIRIILTGH